MKSYKDLMVYQKSYELAVEMYREVGSKMPKEERYGLTSQIKRAATSIPLNIAEGFGKASGEKETLRYLQMSRGSCAEMEVLLDLLKDLGYIEEEKQKGYVTRYIEVGKMLTGLMKGLTNN